METLSVVTVPCVTLTCSVIVEAGEELHEFVFVLEQDVLDGLRLAGVSHEHLHTQTMTTPYQTDPPKLSYKP